MRRYIFCNPLSQLPTYTYDVVIAGAGISGLYTALQLNPDLSCAILVKGQLLQCNSSLAQGGIAAAVQEEDHHLCHLEDTLKAAAGMAHQEHAQIMTLQGPQEIHRLAGMGVNFDKNDNGQWHATMEGAHTQKRVLHCGGDATGKVIMDKLIHLAYTRPNIHILEDHCLTDILVNAHGEVAGAVVWADGFKALTASQVVMCTGGAGGLYQFTTNQETLTGDGVAAALRAGAVVDHMEFVQFHPTAFYHPKSEKSLFLISEAVRGEGGVLRNAMGEAFMKDKHPRKDLAPRDITAREIFLQMQRHQSTHVFLDIRTRSQDYLQKRFPTIYKECLAQGYRMEKDLIPVTPAQHYIMGGIRTNQFGHTSVPGLYACGETACTGVHGANRLASNSLLECLVFAAQCAGHINQHQRSQPVPYLTTEHPTLKEESFDTARIRSEIRQFMQRHGGIVRNRSGLQIALNFMLHTIEKMNTHPLNSFSYIEVYNMAIVAAEILQAALDRKTNVGSHYRDDL